MPRGIDIEEGAPERAREEMEAAGAQRTIASDFV